MASDFPAQASTSMTVQVMSVRNVRMTVPRRFVSMHVAVRPSRHHFMGMIMMPIVMGVSMLMPQGFMVMFMVM